MLETNANVTAGDSMEVLTPVDGTITANPKATKAAPANIAQLLVSYGSKQTFNKGQYIIREGLHDKTVYIILSGEVEILKRDHDGKDQVITKLSDGGTILGEMSIFLDEPRSTSVRISENTLALVFTGEKFFEAVVNTPELSMRILKSLSTKVKITNERLVENTVCPACGTKMGNNKAERTGRE